MKPLLDANLSHRILTALVDKFPGSTHVRDIGLARASDDEIWIFARSDDFTIVTLDSDFYDLSVLRGAPPQVNWLLSIDTKTQTIEDLLVNHADEIHAFSADGDATCLVLGANR